MDRRHLLAAIAGSGVSGLMATRAVAQASPGLIPMRLSANEVMRTTVCLRPFRAQGPRIEAEAFGRKTVVHNYGHGGSGWSLSWGAAFEAVKLAMAGSPRRIAVVGAGAIGLTTALTAQQAGAEVTIYAKERFPFVRSARATGTWSPDSRVALTGSVAPEFGDTWERMARRSWALHNAYVGLPGDPAEWLDQYGIRPMPDAEPPQPAGPERPDPGMIELESRLRDIVPYGRVIGNDEHPFNSERVSRHRHLTFNVTAYAHTLEQDFINAGGRFVTAQFNEPADLGRLKEGVIINCTGYGARALFKDESIVPVRGQIVWLAPQDGVHYAFFYRDTIVLARRDGIVIQALGPDDNFGMNDDNETPDMAAAAAVFETLAGVYRPS